MNTIKSISIKSISTIIKSIGAADCNLPLPEKTPVRVGTLQEGKLKVMKAARGQWAPYHVMLSKTDIKFCHPESLKLDPTLNISLESECYVFFSKRLLNLHNRMMLTMARFFH